jgi:hypothetical protein
LFGCGKTMATTNNNHNDDEDDEQFRRDYSKKLAEAFLAQESERKQPSKTSKRDLALAAYRALCHDDPRVESDAALAALGDALLDGTLALSERLVDGILQATQRIERNTIGTKNKADDEDDDESKTGEQINEPLVLSTNAATAAGYATLAVTVFLKIPLQCCQGADLARIQRFLGSYMGPERRKEDSTFEHQHDDEQHVEAVREFLDHMNTGDDHVHENGSSNAVAPETDHDSLEEVWAAESDPSDFEYESSYNPQNMLQELENWPDESAFDPAKLSEPNRSLSWDDARRAIANLVDELQYSKLGCLSKSQWKSLQMSDLLTQLALLLLVQPSLLGLDEGDEELNIIRHLGIRPLFVLRDRAAAKHDVWNEYLVLLQSLISVHAAQSKSSQITSIAPGTRVGLSSLSAVCQSLQTIEGLNPKRLRQCVIELCEDLANLLEEQQEKPETSEESTRLNLAVLPLLDRLANIKPDGTVLVASISGGVSNSDAQLLLSSGLFRALVLSYAAGQEGTPIISFVRTHLLQCLFVLSLQSPSLLGKYAWRVPELSQCLHQPTFAEHCVIDALLWNLLGTTLASGGSVRLNLNKKGPAAPVVTPEGCREVCLDCFQRSCQQVSTALDEIRQIRQDDKLDARLEQQSKEIISDFARFANYFTSCPNLASLWNDVAAATETKTMIESSLSFVHVALSKLPHVSSTTSSPRNSEKSAENDKAGEPSSRRNPQFEEEEGAIRRALKILSLSLQQASGGRTAGSGVELSSKTD